MFILNSLYQVDPLGAQKAIMEVANSLALDITISVVNEIVLSKSGNALSLW